MRVLIFIALLVGVAFMILFVLTDLARELSRHSFLSSPDLDSSDDCDGAADDDLVDAAAKMPCCAERSTVNRHPIERMRCNPIPGRSNALDDLRSAL
jgi:hypothetical protein